MSVAKSIIRSVLVGLGICFLAMIVGAMLVGDIPWTIMVLALFGGIMGGLGMELTD